MVAERGAILSHEGGVVVPAGERVQEDVAYASVETALRLERDSLVVGLEEVGIVHPDLSRASVLRERLEQPLCLGSELVHADPRQVLRVDLVHVHAAQVNLLGELRVVADLEELLSGLVLEGQVPVERVRRAVVDVHEVYAPLDEPRSARTEVVIEVGVAGDLKEGRGHPVAEQRYATAGEVACPPKPLTAGLQDVPVVVATVHHGETAADDRVAASPGLDGKAETGPEVVAVRTDGIPRESVTPRKEECSGLAGTDAVGACGRQR